MPHKHNISDDLDRLYHLGWLVLAGALVGIVFGVVSLALVLWWILR